MLKQLESSPELNAKYQRIRKHARNIMISAYDVTKRCNLRCEGCTFFEGDAQTQYDEIEDIEAYRDFFQAESDRGITFPHFAGAEPGLVQDRLLIANTIWQRGLVYTNGTYPIDKALSFMLHVSVWGDFANDRLLRGAPVFKKALKNMRDDKRAVFMYTVNSRNLKDVPSVIAHVKDHGCKISFNHYSPSRQYQEKLQSRQKPDKKGTFRLSNVDDHLMLEGDDLKKCRDILDGAITDHPETVVYSRVYNDYVSKEEGLWQLNEKGVATNCSILNSPYHRQYHTDFSYNDNECCLPNGDCASCRHYCSVYTSLMGRRPDFRNIEQFSTWLEVYDTWCRLHFPCWGDLN